ncbi:hypothetical protein PPL_10620 [Heterostelium album PN500]|uniref:Acyl-coenzyme A oxidase n=1 Tax=Heterostelium pallidum (strain ATCC 26659 / Pp 5 / PN500) TaxID=670386 RepID=D3BRK9_HETP5|nr:hypothetical protein PPL_10620 [Heterostelium album PN500]EFA76041.1 hypothetical protein PPL_10620 [Heterostelium album PN500]|eukprot:XP_020428175.1 hypothetical protein PPL_10620 [Heterostelium album PN500]
MESNNTNSSLNVSSLNKVPQQLSAAIKQQQQQQQQPQKQQPQSTVKPPKVLKPLCLNGTKIDFPVAALKSFMDGPYEPFLDHLRNMFNQPTFSILSDGGDLNSRRRNASMKCKAFLEQSGIAYKDIKSEIGRLMAPAVVIGMLCDFSASVKMGVHVWLYGGSIAHLGTAKHQEFYNDSVRKFEAPGCFAMTELGHGSNIRSLETIATYNHARRSFVIQTPTASARKVFLGNSGEAQFAVVFARLLMPSHAGQQAQDHGLHGFAVRIRDTNKSLFRGVNWSDCGEKMGLNGTDNGYLWFDQFEVPYDALLDAHGSIDVNGVYTSIHKNQGKRFTAMLSALFYTRLAVSGGCVGASQAALSIAINYAFQRRQFGLPQQPEELLIHYSTHQSRLMPSLAGSVIMGVVQMYIEERWAKVSAVDQREVETLICGFKAFSTWESVNALQNARECSGGQGYLASNIIALLRIDADVMLTLEGDNTVLCQQVAKDLITDMQKKGAFGFLMNNITEEMATYFSSGDILSPEFLIYVLGYRESRLCRMAAMRLRKMAKLHGGFSAWNKCLDHLIILAKAHVERRIIEIFYQRMLANAKPEIAGILKLILTTYALYLIDRSRGFYIEHSIISKKRCKQIKNTLVRLCEDMTVNSKDIIQSFGVPKQFQNVPMLNSKF